MRNVKIDLVGEAIERMIDQAGMLENHFVTSPMPGLDHLDQNVTKRRS